MPKKIEIVEMVSHKLNGGDSMADGQSKYHPAMIAEVVGVVYSNMIGTLVKQNNASRNDSFLLDNYTKTFTEVPVELDVSRQEYFSTLPVEVLSLPMQAGVRFISPQYDQSYQFIQRSNNSSVVFDELEVNLVETTPKYYVENNNVYYKFTGEIPETVLMKVCPEFSFLDDYDEVEVPSITTRDGFFTLFDLVERKFLTMPPEDLVNNANPVQQ